MIPFRGDCRRAPGAGPQVQAWLGAALLLLGFAPGHALAAFGGTPNGICYVVADQPGNDNAYRYDISVTPPLETAFTNDTGTANIEASEYDPVADIYYAWNADDFGIIATPPAGGGAFTSLGTDPSPGTDPNARLCGIQGGNYVCVSDDAAANQALGMKTGTYDVDGLALDPVSDLWFAAIRIDDGNTSGNQRADWLAVHGDDGVFIADYFGYNDPPANTQPIGFREIQIQGGLHDIDDLAFNPTTGQVYGAANISGSSPTIIVEISRADATTTDLGTIDVDTNCGNGTPNGNLTDVEGLSVDEIGNIFAVVGTNGGGNNGCLSNSMYYLGTVDDLGSSTITAEYLRALSETDQESISCSDYATVIVGDRVFRDTNGNGIQDGGEVGISGVVLNIYDTAGHLLGFRTTDVNGDYLFDGMLRATVDGYRVEVVAANFQPGGALEDFFQTADPDESGTCSVCNNQGNSTALPNDGDADLTLDFGYRHVSDIAADLRIIKTASPDPVVVGEPLTYTLTVTNNGPDTATAVVVSDTLSSAVTHVSTTPSQGSCSAPAGVTCELGDIANGASATVTIVVTVN